MPKPWSFSRIKEFLKKVRPNRRSTVLVFLIAAGLITPRVLGRLGYETASLVKDLGGANTLIKSQNAYNRLQSGEIREEEFRAIQNKIWGAYTPHPKYLLTAQKIWRASQTKKAAAVGAVTFPALVLGTAAMLRKRRNQRSKR